MPTSVPRHNTRINRLVAEAEIIYLNYVCMGITKMYPLELQVCVIHLYSLLRYIHIEYPMARSSAPRCNLSHQNAVSLTIEIGERIMVALQLGRFGLTAAGANLMQYWTRSRSYKTIPRYPWTRVSYLPTTHVNAIARLKM